MADAPQLTELIRQLGYNAPAEELRTRLVGMIDNGKAPLVAELGSVVGCLTISIMHVLHRPRPVGRISMFVVDEEVRSQGIGRLLVEAAERRLRDAGCGLIEVTSNMKRTDAHRFYLKLGYEQTSFRFAKSLVD